MPLIYIFFFHREELVRYYDELTRAAERREEHALWLARRHALKNEREKFFETEKNKLEGLRKEIKDEINKGLDETDEPERAPIGATRTQWVINVEPLNTIIESQDNVDRMILNHPSQSTVENFLYNTSSMSESHTRISDKTLATSGRESKRIIRNPTESTIQNLMYPTAEQGVTSEKITDRAMSGIESSTDTRKTSDSLSLSKTKSTDGDFSRSMIQGSSPDHQKGTEVSAPKLCVTTRGSVPPSTVEHLIYPSGDTASGTSKSSRRHEPPSTAEHLIYPSGDTDSGTSKSSRRHEPPSTAEHLIYPSGDTDSNTTKSSRRHGPPSTAEHLIYPSGDTDSNTTKSSRRHEPPSTAEHLMYPSGDTDSNTTKSSRRHEPPSTAEHLIYPSGDTDSGTSKSSRRHEPPSTAQHLMYPSGDTSNVTPKSTRGSEPLSTIQKLLYPAPSATQGNISLCWVIIVVIIMIIDSNDDYDNDDHVFIEPEIQEREPLTHEDVWLATEFESYPDNFDILSMIF